MKVSTRKQNFMKIFYQKTEPCEGIYQKTKPCEGIYQKTELYMKISPENVKRLQRQL